LSEEARRAVRWHRVALTLLGVLHPFGYYAAVVITAIAKLGGGGRDVSLLVHFGGVAALVGAAVALALRPMSRALPAPVRWRAFGAWGLWILAAGGGPWTVEPLLDATGGGHAYFAPMVLVVLATIAGVAAVRVSRS
jgi:hypothetical protein